LNETKNLRILVYGAGPVGSYITYQLQDAGLDVTILARDKRVDYIRRYGVVLEPSDTGRTTSRKVSVIGRLFPEDAYDLVLVTVGKNRYSGVLPFLSANISTPNVLFLGNNVEGPGEMVRLLGRERVLLGFPVMSGVMAGGVARYKTGEKTSIMMGELDGSDSERTKWISEALEGAGLEVSLNPDVEVWLKYHAAVILPLACVYIDAGRDVKELDRKGLNLAIRAIREGFSALKEIGHTVVPKGLRRLEQLPIMFAVPYLQRELSKPELEYIFVKGQAMQGELETLNEEFRELVRSSSSQTPVYNELSKVLTG
jgi:2-dehydropantoate 2-reductase